MRNWAVALVLAGGLLLASACSSSTDQTLRPKSKAAQKQQKGPSGTALSQPESSVPAAQATEAQQPAPDYSAPVYAKPVPAYIPSRRSARSTPSRSVRPLQSPRQPTYSARVPAAASQPAAPPIFSGTAPAQSETRASAPEPVPLPDSQVPAEPSSRDLRRTQRQEEVIAQQPESVPPAPPREEKVTIPAGTELTIRTLDRISSEDARAGERFQAILY